MSFEIQYGDVAGFDLGGWRLKNGTIKFGHPGRIIDDWPKEITLLGSTYTLEDVKKGAFDENDAQWENALYC